MLSSMNIGGVEKSFLSLLQTIDREEYDITVILLEKKGGFLNYLPKDIKIEEAIWFKNIKPLIMDTPQKNISRYIENKKTIKAINFAMSYILAKKSGNRYIFYKNILKSIPENKDIYDLAIAYAGPTEIIDLYIAKKVRANRKISWVHCDVSKYQINKKLYKKIYGTYNNIFTVSNEAKYKLLETITGIDKRVDVFKNIILSDVINSMANEVQDIEYDNSFINIATVGRLSKEKGQDLAIRAMYKLKKEGYKVRWYCIGEGKERINYEKLIEEYNLEKEFILVGATSNPYPYIKNSDIYVQTSRHEGYCLTLAEAKVLKKVIVTTNFTGAKEQIENNKTGFIVKIDDECIKNSIKTIINDKKLRDKILLNINNL